MTLLSYLGKYTHTQMAAYKGEQYKNETQLFAISR